MPRLASKQRTRTWAPSASGPHNPRDADIDDSDIPKLGKSFWKAAKLTMPEPKDRLTIRIDHDVVKWLKKKGSGYQTRINAILRSYMKAQSEEHADRRT